MRAVVIAGGLGTRLHPYTTILPKSLLPVGELPVIEYTLRRLHAAGIRCVDLCVGNLGELIRAYLDEADDRGRELELRWHREAEPLGTAGALRAVAGIESPFLVINGDILTALDFRELEAAHRTSGALVTIATQPTTVNVPYGVVITGGPGLEGGHGRIVGYEEKPEPIYRVSMGAYMLEDDALRYLPEGACQFPEFVQRLLDGGETVAAYDSEAAWFDIGTFAQYDEAVRYLDAHPEAFTA